MPRKTIFSQKLMFNFYLPKLSTNNKYIEVENQSIFLTIKYMFVHTKTAHY